MGLLLTASPACPHAVSQREWARLAVLANGHVLEGAILVAIALAAFALRLFSVLKFEAVIHEFDPWFNYRATQFLVDNGWDAFINWFDDRVWYPLGRPVGVTVFPGIMATAAALYHVASALLRLPVSVKDVCIFTGPLFSAATILATYLFARELSGGRRTAALIAALLIAVCPGYISRSVAGSFDNEAIAIFLMMATFFGWVRAVKHGSAICAVATAIAYFCMASAWGGYVFIINLIPLHALLLLLIGRFSSRLYRAYSTFYVVGTIASMSVPFIGLQPTRSSEHMAALGVFGLVQLAAALAALRRCLNDDRLARRIAVATFAGIVALFGGAVAVAVAAGQIAPWAGRFYSLWDTEYAAKAMPIVASVSEHQPTTWASFFFDMHIMLMLAPAGLYLCLSVADGGGGDEHLFAVMYAATAAYFAAVMVRLLLTLAPIMCVLSAIATDKLLTVYLTFSALPRRRPVAPPEGAAGGLSQQPPGVELPPSTRTGHGKVAPSSSKHAPSLDEGAIVTWTVFSLFIFFIIHCTWATYSAYSSPSVIMATVDGRTGKRRIIDDFREAFYWLRRNTPSDAKVVAWWDYGYQISGMSERTTIVDNNTWNNDHIALVGQIFASSEEAAYPLLRKLDADYILILSGAASGFGGDDMNKFLWMVRIVEDAHPGGAIKERDYLDVAGEFTVDSRRTPQALRDSLLYKMTYYGVAATMGSLPYPMDQVRGVPIVGVDPQLQSLTEAYYTDNHIVRIFKVNPPNALGRSHFGP